MRLTTPLRIRQRRLRVPDAQHRCSSRRQVPNPSLREPQTQRTDQQHTRKCDQRDPRRIPHVLGRRGRRRRQMFRRLPASCPPRLSPTLLAGTRTLTRRLTCLRRKRRRLRSRTRPHRTRRSRTVCAQRARPASSGLCRCTTRPQRRRPTCTLGGLHRTVRPQRGRPTRSIRAQRARPTCSIRAQPRGARGIFTHRTRLRPQRVLVHDCRDRGATPRRSRLRSHRVHVRGWNVQVQTTRRIRIELERSGLLRCSFRRRSFRIDDWLRSPLLPTFTQRTRRQRGAAYRRPLHGNCNPIRTDRRPAQRTHRQLPLWIFRPRRFRRRRRRTEHRHRALLRLRPRTTRTGSCRSRARRSKTRRTPRCPGERRLRCRCRLLALRPRGPGRRMLLQRVAGLMPKRRPPRLRRRTHARHRPRIIREERRNRIFLDLNLGQSRDHRVREHALDVRRGRARSFGSSELTVPPVETLGRRVVLIVWRCVIRQGYSS